MMIRRKDFRSPGVSWLRGLGEAVRDLPGEGGEIASTLAWYSLRASWTIASVTGVSSSIQWSRYLSKRVTEAPGVGPPGKGGSPPLRPGTTTDSSSALRTIRS